MPVKGLHIYGSLLARGSKFWDSMSPFSTDNVPIEELEPISNSKPENLPLPFKHAGFEPGTTNVSGQGGEMVSPPYKVLKPTTNQSGSDYD